MIATKEQERKALEKIRKIIEGLGEDSYIGTAFEGCFEIAEENIANDFADSMKQRAERADEDSVRAQKENAEAQTELAATKEELADAKEQIEILRKQIIDKNDLENLLVLAWERQVALGREMKDAAERIIENADEPESIEFKTAVNDHRSAKRAAGKYAELVERVSKSRG